MSTYQDRAREVLDTILPRVGEHDGMTEELREAVITKALSELASIVSEEQQEAYKRGYIDGGLEQINKETT